MLSNTTVFFRDWYDEDVRASNLGFRLVRRK